LGKGAGVLIFFIVIFLSLLVVAELAVILALVNRLLAQAHIPAITPDMRGIVRSDPPPQEPLKRKLFSMRVNA